MPGGGSWIFVGSMGDVFCRSVPYKWLRKLFKYIEECPTDNRFLLMTKNAPRFGACILDLERIKDKVVLGTTLDTTGEAPWSKAPAPILRKTSLALLRRSYGFDTFLSLEPLALFNPALMKQWIYEVDPLAVEIGLENYGSYLPEPREEDLVKLVSWIKREGYTYVLKENLLYLEDLLD